MATATPARAVDRKLQLKEVLDWLVEDGLAMPEVAAKILHDSRFAGSGARHPVVVIAEARLRSPKPPQALLTAEALTEWLAGRAKLPFYHIDPLKIDLRAVTQVMSSEATPCSPPRRSPSGSPGALKMPVLPHRPAQDRPEGGHAGDVARSTRSAAASCRWR